EDTSMYIVIFFFFQAEDGIRDRNVTGVQTCALPICYPMESWLAIITDVGFPIAVTFYSMHRLERKMDLLIESIHTLPSSIREARSEERRVGKECSIGVWREH